MVCGPSCEDIVGKRHLFAFLLFLAYVIAYMQRAAMSMALVAMTDKESNNTDFPVFDWTPEQKSSILSSLLWGNLSSQFLVSYLVRNRGSHKLLSFGMLFSGIVLALIPISATHLGWIAVLCCHAALGVIQSCLNPISKLMLSRWIPISERASIGSFVMMSGQLGNALSMGFSGILAASRLGWPGIFYVFAGLGISWAILFYFLGADTPFDHKLVSFKEKELIQNSYQESVSQNIKLKFPFKAAFTSIPYLALLVTTAMSDICIQIFLMEMPAYLKNGLNFDIANSGYASAVPFLLQFFGGFIFGIASDFALRKGASLNIIRKVCSTFGLWGPASTLLILSITKPTDKIVAVALLASTLGLRSALFSSLALNEMDISPNFSGVLASINNSLAKVSSTVPYITNLIVTDPKNLDQWYWLFFLAACLYFVANVIFLTFGSAEVQPWNKPVSTIKSQIKADKVQDEQKVFVGN